MMQQIKCLILQTDVFNNAVAKYGVITPVTFSLSMCNETL